nr:MAG TPA: 60S ribosomal protein L2-A [Caudoviricetes sp.]
MKELKLYQWDDDEDEGEDEEDWRYWGEEL